MGTLISMDSLLSLIIIILTFSAFFIPLKIFLNILKYKDAALGLIFTKLKESIMAFKIYAIAVLIFATGRLIDLLNIVSSSSAIDDFATVLNLTTTILLIYAFYRLLLIMRIKEHNL